MGNDNLIKNFARTSLRLNMLLIVAVSLAILLFAMTYWAAARLVQEQLFKIEFHFSRLMGNIHEQEEFLLRVARHSDEVTQKRDQAVIPFQHRLLKEARDSWIYEGREFSFSMPFTLAVPTEMASQGEDQVAGIGKFGVLISNLYGSYWSISSYAAPQTLLLDLDSSISIGVPAATASRENGQVGKNDYLELSENLKKQILKFRPAQSDNAVMWAPANHVQGDGSSIKFITYMYTDTPQNLLAHDQSKRQLVIASLLDLRSITDSSRLSDWTVFDAMELITPDGLLLTGKIPSFDDAQEGLQLTSAGFLVKTTSKDGWRGYYHLDYRSFFQYAKWQLLVLLAVCLAFVVVGYFLLRWYAMRVVVPARRAHDRVVESDSFSRAIIQSAPVALCVLARKDRKVVMENELALQWLGDTQTISQLSRGWPSVAESAGAVRDKHLSITINDRQLEVSFSPSRYQGEDVVLCAFSDISAYKLAERALAEAKQSADASNEAKTVFLATMSHEIRTPLYGVLGTLELLTLSPLNALQRSQVQTMQRSSSILLQVISDILDVSKIEAGQLAIEHVEFSPLEMIEDVLQAYSAAAGAKGLHLYACVEVELPRRVRGDAARIRQILNNLLSNAIKFTDVGRIALRVKSEQVEGRWQFQWQVTDTGCGISSEHQVRLFEPFYQAHSQQHTVGGTGLGLSICWRLTQLMGGNLAIVSDTGLGSSFTLSLPLTVVPGEHPLLPGFTLKNEAVAVRAPIKELAISVCSWLSHFGALAVTGSEVSDDRYPGAVLVDVIPELLPELEWSGERVRCSEEGLIKPQRTSDGYIVSLHSLKGLLRAVALAQGEPLAASESAEAVQSWCRFSLHVLVAEDNPINQTLLKEQLQQLGCSVALASNGVEALRLWDHDAFDVVLTDVNMPEMNGYELTAALRRADSNTPIVGVTANALREEEERCIGVGMNACVVKPMSLQTLNNVLLKLCGHLDGAILSEEEASEEKSVMQVSSQLRDVFIQTFKEDLAKTRAAVRDKDAKAVGSMLHRIRGGLSVVQAQDLLDRCVAIEAQLDAQGWVEERRREVEDVLEQITQEMEKL
ncbi:MULTISPECIES: hybrid sensor histidine kinase/response regulator [Pseudomonas]|uniref:histidine kinase n=3 Tax=Pseudomonas chlororaphis TaxID=587753 RepID=A0AAP9W4Q0_9PSED|nr:MULTISPECIES: hybrid sensor histidine kinase/response regulator [Pseudomonas]AIC19421.1 histidine kinase [Pseudomonas chlororaphis]AUG40468.1 sensor histidine kinase [Pseudomonas chlororaphis]AZD21629.1 sensory box histidine kinase/response regulator [Pseudomonas chlororaphis subsp. aurantiaca]AZD72681.1 sensory box histidine kinase/response regulator [Pseudomonas chlororaphis subsp. aurantiaca]AZD85354.1 sensory box histidine kinase/response regulator [Pseudomonas chlororaphis subsp. aureo